MNVGDRIELVNMPHDPNPIEPGTQGTVTSVTFVSGVVPVPYDQVHVEWDNGRKLSLCVPPDQVRVLSKKGGN